MESDSNDQRLAVRHVAEVNFKIASEAHSRLLDESSAASRWIMATLLTINSGGAITCITTDKLTGAEKFWSIALFSVGVFSALMLGYSTILAVQVVIKRVSELMDFWIKALLQESLDQTELSAKQAAMRSSAMPWRIGSHVLGWLSAICFVAALFSVANQLSGSISPPHHPPQPPCRPNQVGG